MRSIAASFALAGVLFGLASSQQHPLPRKQYTIEQFLATATISGGSFSFDEKRILFSSDRSGVINAWSIPVSGGTPTRLTHSTESTLAVAYFPKDDRILLARDTGGNANHHLYVLSSDGTERDLTPGAKVKAAFLGWADDDQAFYLQVNERDRRFFDVYRVDTQNYSRKLLYRDETGYQINDISRDERHVVFAKTRTTVDSDLYLYNVSTKRMRHITSHPGQALYAGARFSPDSKSLYYLTNRDAEFTYVERLDFATGQRRVLDQPPWDVIYHFFSRDGRYRVLGVNEDARTKISIYETATGRPLRLPVLPDGDITSATFSRSGQLLRFHSSGDRTPPDLFILDLKSGEHRRLTNNLSPDIDPQDLVDANVVRYRSFDGMETPSILIKPHQASAANKAPALVWVHGGPGGQTRKGYNALMQYLANHGYVILGVNNRGSSGYGKSFFTADDRKHGREPLWDCIEGKKYLASLGYVDPERIGILGGSYGGYMTLAALSLKPHEFALGVDIFGISNWVRTLESMPPYWNAFREVLFTEIGHPVKDRDMLLAISPLFHADKIVRPLMVLQGANDVQVIRQESDDIVAAVRKNGGTVEYIVFDDEGHGFTKKANQIKGYGAILEFLNKHLREAGR